MIDALELGLAESFSGAQTMDLITDRRALHRNVNELPGEIVLSRLATLIHNADANRKSGNFMISAGIEPESGTLTTTPPFLPIDQDCAHLTLAERQSQTLKSRGVESHLLLISQLDASCTDWIHGADYLAAFEDYRAVLIRNNHTFVAFMRGYSASLHFYLQDVMGRLFNLAQFKGDFLSAYRNSTRQGYEPLRRSMQQRAFLPLISFMEKSQIALYTSKNGLLGTKMHRITAKSMDCD